ncbi:MAG: fumarate hydratase [Deltaproteobacteria bacterium]|jgi:fumarate hydratase, class I|nr:fumarate hydratase [Deltaproteobacteria bacterium]MBT4090999.1 fumarate hydratase [Deltaproteobacteria bacterium]MBT4269314.1 fumarate hydratase [Deltaproteobacteria bacterium]MBT4643248.1 fumarate hydratase [Deltaproteobacteria bacterium]MBT6498533.1 fumarate hydratase [Deltaproteobacteria bacterium]
MSEFAYQDIFVQGEDSCEYRMLTKDYVSTTVLDGKPILKVDPQGLTLLAKEAMHDVSHLLRKSHLEGLKKITEDHEASPNDVYVATTLLDNAVIAAEKEFPSCQDTGTAIVMGKKGECVMTGANDAEALSKGVFQTYTETNLRYSQTAPLSMYEEVNTGNNLPAQIDIYATPGEAYKFLFMAKGGGSANKTYLFQETKALLTPEKLLKFLEEKVASLGTAACPPYHLAVVIGGTSAEMNLKTVKLASAKYYDDIPTEGNKLGQGFRDLEMEEAVLKLSQGLGLGSQFGGKYFCHDVRVIRLPRHGASCPVGIGVSCSADRNIKGKITKEGIFLEKMETNPAQYLPVRVSGSDEEVLKLDLSMGMDKLRETLTQYPIKTRVMLTGKIIVARDIAHAKLNEMLEKGEGLPDYFKEHIIYYAGPAKTPEGYASGSFGPTTAGRMDSYVPIFQKEGGSLVMLAKGNRTQQVTDACQQYGGFYLGSIGGAAALLGKDCITNVQVLAYPEFGMEAIYMITVKDFPAFVIVDDKGNDFFKSL